MPSFRTGHGFDVHAFDDGEGFVLGGVFIECDRKVIAHSDGDVLIHALCDALLGALALGDIGRLFPDDDVDNAGRDSREFLREVNRRLRSEGWRLGNADMTVMAQAPRLAARIDAMRANIAQDLDCSPVQISVKATTTEKLGFVGREEGIAAEAVVLLEGAE